MLNKKNWHCKIMGERGEGEKESREGDKEKRKVEKIEREGVTPLL